MRYIVFSFVTLGLVFALLFGGFATPTEAFVSALLVSIGLLFHQGVRNWSNAKTAFGGLVAANLMVTLVILVIIKFEAPDCPTSIFQRNDLGFGSCITYFWITEVFYKYIGLILAFVVSLFWVALVRLVSLPKVAYWKLIVASPFMVSLCFEVLFLLRLNFWTLAV